MATQTITLTSTGQSVGDGTKPVVVSSASPFYYGFGESTPTVWHFANNVSEPWTFGTNFGGLYLKADGSKEHNVTVSIGSLVRPSGDQSTAMPVIVQNAVTVSGSTAQDSGAPNPVAIGGRATNVNQTAMSATGDLVHTTHTMIGALVNKPYCIPEVEWVYTGALTLTSDVAAKAAAGTGIKNHVTLIQATNTEAIGDNSLIVKDGTTVRLKVTVPAGQSVVIPLNTGIPLTANTALNVALSAAGKVQVNLLGYTAP